MRVTLVKIANKANVSPSTVSRALSRDARVAEKTRQKIFKICEELNYQPDEFARGLVRGTSNIIGSLIYEFSNPFFSPFIEAIENVADEHEYLVMFGESRRRASIETRFVERLQRLRIAGYLIFPVLENKVHLLNIRKSGVPIIVVGRRCPELDYICAVDEQGGMAVGQHLLKLGHSKMAYLCSGDAYHEPEQARWHGFQKALEEAGIPIDQIRYIQAGSMRAEAGYNEVENILKLSPRPTAVFASGDRLAIGLIHRLRQLGLQIPGDMAVVGYDDNPGDEYFEVPLTTVSYPKYEMGHLAAEMLFDRIEGKSAKKIEHIHLEPELIVRQSCGYHL